MTKLDELAELIFSDINETIKMKVNIKLKNFFIQSHP